MKRPRILFVSRHLRSAAALTAYIRTLIPAGGVAHFLESFVFENTFDLFERLNNLSLSEASETMVVFDGCADRHRLWDFAGIGIGDRGIGVQLVLQYPEIYFVFIDGDDPHFTSEMREHHVVSLGNLSKLIELMRLHENGARFLYDPTGLRSLLKTELIAVDKTARNSYLPLWRSRLERPACVIEDEPTFAHFNGYASYRAGFRTYIVTGFRELERLLPGPSMQPTASWLVSFHTVVTDWDVRFPDFIPSDKVSELALSARLACTSARIIVVTSNKNLAVEGSLTQWPELSARKIAESKAAVTRLAAMRCIQKPYPGLFTLIDVLREGGQPSSCQQISKTQERHTAPYGASSIAANLLTRLKQMSTSDTADYGVNLQLAALSGEAKELLGGLSPTTFIETLSHQNGFEIRAESSYLGMLSRIEPEGRLRALEEEMTFGVLTDAREFEKERTRIDCLIQQCSKFRGIYSEYDEVGAAESCLQQLARFQRLRLLHGGGFVNRCIYLGMWYSDLVTESGTSLARLLLSDLIIVGIFFAAFAAILIFHPCNTISHSIWLSFGHSVLSFMELQPGLGEYEEIMKCVRPDVGASWIFLYRILLFLEIVLAYVNLGLLISVLYRRVTRRAP